MWRKNLLQTSKIVVANSVGGQVPLTTGFNMLYEQTENGYAVFSPDTKKPYQARQELEGVGVTYKPYKKLPWKLPPEPIEYESETQLWNEVRACIYEHLDLPDEHGYDVLSAWIMATWRTEQWKTVPFIFAYGPTSVGKTRLLEILSALCFRGWMTLFISPPSLYRVLQEFHCSLFLDECEAYLGQNEILSLLNGSYRVGQTVARQVETSKGFKTVFFNVFGFKCLGGTRKLAKTLESRCIIFRMSRTTRHLRLFVDEEGARKLRGKLLMYRFRKLSEEFEDSEALQEGAVEEFAESVGGGRLAELFYPLYAVAPTDELKSLITQQAITIGKIRQEALAMTSEVTVLSAIMQAYTEGKIDHGLILLRDVTYIVNESLSFKEEWKTRRVGALCSRLGFTKTRATRGLTALRWDSKLIERLKKDKRYESCFKPHPSQSASKSSLSSQYWLEDALKNKKQKNKEEQKI